MGTNYTLYTLIELATILNNHLVSFFVPAGSCRPAFLLKKTLYLKETRHIYAQHLVRIDREIKSILQMLCSIGMDSSWSPLPQELGVEAKTTSAYQIWHGLL